jgi:hypothetical protein
MKILLHFLSEAFNQKSISQEIQSAHFKKVISLAQKQGIRIWHAGKKIELTEDDFLFSVDFDRFSINWGGYGSRISRENLYKYFGFQYPNDENTDTYFKSKISLKKKPFSLCKVFIDGEFTSDLKTALANSGAIVESSIHENIALIIRSNQAKNLDSQGAFVLEKDLLIKELSLLYPPPKKRSLKAKSTPIAIITENPETIIEPSLLIHKQTLIELKSFLTSDRMEVIDSGLLMLESLNNMELIDALTKGFKVKNDTIIPNSTFKGLKKHQPLLNYSFMGVIALATDQSKEAIQLKNELKSLRIDVPNLKFIPAFKNLEVLILSDSLGQLTNLDELSSLNHLKSITLDHCANITSIDGIKNLPLVEFNFGTSNKITSFLPIKGKIDKTNITKLTLNDFESLENLDGIEFYQNLTELNLYDCRKLTNFCAIKRIPQIVEINSRSYRFNDYNFPLLNNLDGLIQQKISSLSIKLKDIVENSFEIFPNVKHLRVIASEMKYLEWLNKFPNLRCLEISGDNITDIKGLKKVPQLLGLIIDCPILEDYSPISKLENLLAINIKNGIKCTSLNFINDLPKLRLMGNQFNDFYSVNDSYKISSIEEFQTKSTLTESKIGLEGLPNLMDLNPIFNHPFFQKNITEITLKNVNLEQVFDINQFSKLTKLEINNSSFSEKSLEEILQLPSLNFLHIDSCKELKMKLINKNNFTLSIDQVEHVQIENCVIPKIIHCIPKSILFKNNKIETLTICNSKTLLSFPIFDEETQIHILELKDLNYLNDLREITRIKKLNFLHLENLSSLKDVSFFALLQELNQVYTNGCDFLDITPKPMGLMKKIDVIKYQIAICEYYQIPQLSQFKQVLENEKTSKSKSLSRKEISSIKKLLLSRDLNLIKNAIELIDATQDEELINDLLEGIRFDGKKIIPNNLFSGSKPAQPFLNAGMIGVLGIGNKIEKWKLFNNSIHEIEIEIAILDFISIFKNAKRMTVSHVLEFNSGLELPNLIDFSWKHEISSSDYLYDYPKPCISFPSTFFDGCQNLESLTIDPRIKILGDSIGFSRQPNLKILILKRIEHWEITDLEFLKNCNGLEQLIIEFFSSSIGKISSLKGIENCAGLKIFILKYVSLENTKHLEKLEKLETIEIYSDALEVYSPPKTCLFLQKLLLGERIYSTTSFPFFKLKRLEPSVYRKDMEKISLSNCPIEQMPSFKNLKKINFLDLNSSSISNFNQLNEIEEIGSLKLEYCKNLIDFTGLEKVKNIKDLDVSGCTHLRSFAGLQKANITSQKLYLNNCPSIVSMTELPKIQWKLIRLDTISLPSFSPDFYCQNLEMPLVQNIQEIGVLKNVQRITLVSNDNLGHPLKDFSPFVNLPELKELKIKTKNPLSLKHLSQFYHLRLLNITECEQLSDPNELAESRIDLIYIFRSNLKKADFPKSLENNINWQENPYNF